MWNAHVRLWTVARSALATLFFLGTVGCVVTITTKSIIEVITAISCVLCKLATYVIDKLRRLAIGAAYALGIVKVRGWRRVNPAAFIDFTANFNVMTGPVVSFHWLHVSADRTKLDVVIWSYFLVAKAENLVSVVVG
jgi:hypothetical protein